jgi:DNA-binding IclR family transcriptional regulator
MRSLTVVHRTQLELEHSLMRLLADTAHGLDAAELALRAGCGAARVHAHLSRLEREGRAVRIDEPSGSRWALAEAV